MQPWQELDNQTEDVVWNRFDDVFNFRPSISATQWPGIDEPTPSVTYSIEILSDSGIDQNEFQRLANDLHHKLLGAFRSCTSATERLYALDWQHTCYWFYPHANIEVDNPVAWNISIWPNADYYIFLKEDFTIGTFAHPWEDTICVIGQPFINAVERDLPQCFREVRRDGR